MLGRKNKGIKEYPNNLVNNCKFIFNGIFFIKIGYKLSKDSENNFSNI